MYKIKPILNEEFLKQEFYRLFTLFVPMRAQYLPDVEFRLVDSHPNKYAAQCFLEEGVVEFYLDYHYAHPDDYKVTLLHEAAHFVYGEGHKYFKDYYEYLKLREPFVGLEILPDDYQEFLYGKPFGCDTYTFKCSGCRGSRVAINFDRAWCEKCDRQMLLVNGI
jgi:hypothetical protein